jgi:hypothetical protein
LLVTAIRAGRPLTWNDHAASEWTELQSGTTRSRYVAAATGKLHRRPPALARGLRRGSHFPHLAKQLVREPSTLGLRYVSVIAIPAGSARRTPQPRRVGAVPSPLLRLARRCTHGEAALWIGTWRAVGVLPTQLFDRWIGNRPAEVNLNVAHRPPPALARGEGESHAALGRPDSGLVSLTDSPPLSARF